MTYLLRFLMAFWRRTLRLFDYPLPPFPGLLRVLDALFPFKLVLTGLGAEVKGLVLAMGVEPGLFFIYLHAAYRVLYHKNLHQKVHYVFKIQKLGPALLTLLHYPLLMIFLLYSLFNACAALNVFPNSFHGHGRGCFLLLRIRPKGLKA